MIIEKCRHIQSLLEHPYEYLCLQAILEDKNYCDIHISSKKVLPYLKRQFIKVELIRKKKKRLFQSTKISLIARCYF